MLRRTIPEITLAANDLESVTRFFTEMLGFERSTYTFDYQGEVDPVVRHGDIEIRFRRCIHSETPTSSTMTGIVIECDDCQRWADLMFAKGLQPSYVHDIGQPLRLKYWIKDGFYLAFEQPDAA
jgi:hypothetical protein